MGPSSAIARIALPRSVKRIADHTPMAMASASEREQFGDGHVQLADGELQAL
jgi:hypothetical protein